MRVAIDATAIPLALTGAGYYVQEIIKQLDSSNEVDLFIITKTNDVQRFRSLAPNSEVIGKAPENKILRLLYQTFSLGKFVDSLGADLFFGPHYQIPKNMKTPSVVTIHDMTLITHKEVHTKSKSKYFSKVIPQSIQLASAVITVSQHTADDIAKAGIKHDNIHIAPLGVNTSRFNPNRPNDASKSDVDLLKARGIQKPFIAYLGLIEPRKCIPTLIEAFSKVASDFPDHKLVIAGAQGWDFSEVKDAIEKSNISTKIILPGRLSDEEVPALLRQTDVFVYPSMYEGFGMPVLEAMACGAPVITSNTSSLKEVASQSAMLVEPKNVDELANALTQLLSIEKTAKLYSKKGIERAKQFSWEKCAELHLQAFNSALRV